MQNKIENQNKYNKEKNGLFSGLTGNIMIFFIGGLIVTSVNLLSEFVNQKMAAVLWGIPFTLFPLMIFMYKRGESSENIAKLSYSVLFSFFGIFMFALTMGLTVKKMNFWLSLGISALVMIIILVIVTLAICPSPFNKGKCIELGLI